MPVYLLKAPTGRIMVLREVLLQHALTEGRIIPGDVIALRPRLRMCAAVDQVKQVLHIIEKRLAQNRLAVAEENASAAHWRY